jgi:hypothetical protein
MPRLPYGPEYATVAITAVAYTWARGPHRWTIEVEATSPHAVEAVWPIAAAADFLPGPVRAALVAWLTGPRPQPVGPAVDRDDAY